MSRLAFQTQLASIMEVLANAAVAEICKLVDDDYAVVTLQMSQVQKENKALKRKLHLLELKMARGTAERRLREREGRGGLRVTITGGERTRELSPNSDGAMFSPSPLWPLRSITSGLGEESEPQSKSPDVEFVEPDPVVVKEETKMETKEEEVHLIEDNVVMETPPSVPGRPPHVLEPLPSASSQAPPPNRRRRNSAASRRVEDEDPDIVLVKVEEPEEPKPKSRKSPGLSIQEGLVESSTDDFRSAFADASQMSTNQLSASSPGLSESGSVLTKPSGSDLGLFELEPLLSHWIPNTDSTAPPGGSTAPPGGSTAPAGGSAVRREGEVIDVDDTDEFINERRGDKLRVSQGQAPPSALSSLQIRSVHSRWTPAVLLQNHPGTSQQTPSNPTLPTNPGAPQPTLPTNPGTPQPTLPTNPSFSSARRRGPNLIHPLPNPRAKGSRKVECRTCGKAFPAWSNLEIHQRVHTGEKPFVCHTCGKRFSEAGNLKKHQRVHTGEKPFECDRCGKRFAWICNLKTHQQGATSCARKQSGGETEGEKSSQG